MNRGFANVVIIIALVVIVGGAGWWYLNKSSTSPPTTQPSTLQENVGVGSSVVQQSGITESQTPSKSLTPASPPKQQTTQANPQPPPSSDTTPTCTITANKSTYQHEEPMTFKWTIANAQGGNLKIITEAEDHEDSLTNVLSPGKNLTTITRAVRSSGNVTATLQLLSYSEASGMKSGTCSVTVFVQ